MDEMMKNFFELLEKWKINVPINDDLILTLKSLQDNNFENFYFVDTVPFTVKKEAAYKYNQYEIDKSGYNIIKNKEFMAIKKKYCEIIKKLWLNSELYIYSNIEQILSNEIKLVNKCHKRVFKRTTRRKEYGNVQQINKIQEIEDYNYMGFANIMDMIFYFNDYNVFLIPLWQCYAILFMNKEYISDIERIINVEGLYLRKFK